jgi:hypothetical protein
MHYERDRWWPFVSVAVADRRTWFHSRRASESTTGTACAEQIYPRTVLLGSVLESGLLEDQFADEVADAQRPETDDE